MHWLLGRLLDAAAQVSQGVVRLWARSWIVIGPNGSAQVGIHFCVLILPSFRGTRDIPSGCYPCELCWPGGLCIGEMGHLPMLGP